MPKRDLTPTCKAETRHETAQKKQHTNKTNPTNKENIKLRPARKRLAVKNKNNNTAETVPRKRLAAKHADEEEEEEALNDSDLRGRGLTPTCKEETRRDKKISRSKRRRRRRRSK